MQSVKGGFTIFRNEIWRGAVRFDSTAPGLDCILGGRAKGAASFLCWPPAPISLRSSAVKAMMSLTGRKDTFPKHCGALAAGSGAEAKKRIHRPRITILPFSPVVLTSHQRRLHCIAHAGEIRDLTFSGPCASFSSDTAKPVDCIEMSESRERAWSRMSKEQKAQLGLGDSTPRPHL